MNRRTFLPVSILLLSSVVLTVALAAAPVERIVGYPLIEDSYYSLSIARQIALGRGITIDGSTWTNGFQPLWVVLIAPAYWFTSGARVTSLRAVLVCAAVVWIATAWLVAEFASRARPSQTASTRLWALLLYLTSVTIFEQHFNGLETGLLLLILALLACTASRPNWSTRRTFAVAILCGLLVLTRIDSALFVVLFTVAVACFPRGDPFRARLARAGVIALCSGLVSSPWWLYNVLRFGSLLPSSGSAVFDWHWRPGRALVLLLYSAAHGVPLPIRPFWPWRYEWCAAATVLTALMVVVWRTRGSLGKRALLTMDDTAAARFAAPLAAYIAVLVLAYAMSPAWWMYERYTSPLVILSVPALAMLLSRTTGSVISAVAAPLAALCLLAAIRANVRSPINGFYQSQVRLVQRHVPGNVRVGALQSGTLGYFRDGVVNLDGKVNAAALPARGHLDDYARPIGLNWIVDWPWLLERGFGSLDRWQLVERVDDPKCPQCGFALYRRRPTGDMEQSLPSTVK